MSINKKYTRIDHTKHLIHFTKDSKDWNYEDSYNLFLQIFLEGYLKESSHLRLGNISSVCFTEASYSALAENRTLNKKYFSRYSPFGFMFSKEYIYQQGGLPAIYSPRDHFEINNDKTNWRTVSYNPSGGREEFRDYTWEREWRIRPKDSKLNIYSSHTRLVFPSKAWAEKFSNDYNNVQKKNPANLPCIIIDYDKYFEPISQIGFLDDIVINGWILLSMDCEDIPVPKQ